MSTARHSVWGVSSLMLGVMVLSGCATQQAATPAQPAAAVGDPVQVYAAGSLRDALTEIARDHEARTGQKVVLTFAASGLLRERIEQGAHAQVICLGRHEAPAAPGQPGAVASPCCFHAQHVVRAGAGCGGGNL